MSLECKFTQVTGMQKMQTCLWQANSHMSLACKFTHGCHFENWTDCIFTFLGKTIGFMDKPISKTNSQIPEGCGTSARWPQTWLSYPTTSAEGHVACRYIHELLAKTSNISKYFAIHIFITYAEFHYNAPFMFMWHNIMATLTTLKNIKSFTQIWFTFGSGFKIWP